MNVKKIFDIFVEHSSLYSTDSRNIEEGGLFFALKGDNFNGNLFADEAIEKGAAFAVVDEIHDFKYPGQIIKVTDVLWVFGQIAMEHRLSHNVEVVAIAGSNGKTTTKELAVEILSRKYNVLATEGNFNNEIGVPKTLLNITDETEVAVVELGANKVGDIRKLCKIVQPDVGLLTNIGKEHLEGFGSIEGVIQGEKELFDYLEENEGYCFLNMDDKYIKPMRHDLKNVLSFGYEDESAQIKGKANQFMPNIEGEITLFDEEPFEVKSSLGGTYNFSNILAAATIADYFEVSQEDIQEGVASYVSTNNRSQLIKTESNVVISDAYNANPSSMEEAIRNFATLPEAEKILMLGDMGELGDYAEVEHKELLDNILSLNFSKVYLAGSEFSKHKENFSTFNFASSTKELIDLINKEKPKGAHILLKGSRFMEMDQLTEVL